VIKEIIANVFRSAIALNAKELPDLFYFFIVKLAPEYVGLETGVGHELVLKSAAKACGKTPKQIRELFQKEGDLGMVVSIGKKSQNTIGSFFGGAAKKKQPLSFSHVFESFRKIAKISGNSSVYEKEMTIVKLLQDGDNNEAKYIVRWL
jgi:DNA ligase 1